MQKITCTYGKYVQKLGMNTDIYVQKNKQNLAINSYVQLDIVLM